MDHEKQIRAAIEARASTEKAMRDAASYQTVEERNAAARARLYTTHKVRGSLATYYDIYPDERRAGAERDDNERER